MNIGKVNFAAVFLFALLIGLTKAAGPITDLYINVGYSLDYTCPVGFDRVGINFNQAAKSNVYIYLCYTRDANNAPVTGLGVSIVPNAFGSAPTPPAGYMTIPGNYPTPINVKTGTNGNFVVLWYKRGGIEKPIEQLTVLDSDYGVQNEGCPSPWMTLNANLNSGTTGDPLYFCYIRSL